MFRTTCNSKRDENDRALAGAVAELRESAARWEAILADAREAEEART
ncbi:MAG TPA: hypothetical protein VK920_04105 [Solirubrobacterales bacterium]|nr:hypothetical protein [Solirubrobacterales bacterium]